MDGRSLHSGGEERETRRRERRGNKKDKERDEGRELGAKGVCDLNREQKRAHHLVCPGMNVRD